MTPGFHAMRQSLVDRGLLTDGHQLTPEGHAYVDQLLLDLPTMEADTPIGAPMSVSWNTRGRG